MELTLYFTFLLVSLGIIIIPGPNVLVIVSTSITHGIERGLMTVAGTSLAMVIQLFVSAIITSSFIQLLSNGFIIIKWAGVAYLAYLGLYQIRRSLNTSSLKVQISASSSFLRGFIVSITNPKTILFFGAFLPQFASTEESYLQQITILSVTFLLLAVVLDSCYALFSSRLRPLLNSRKITRLQSGISGSILLCASAWLATIRRA
jgi:threonine/homoserine/homoserine lactone efflux protein